jgi:Cys-tRNA(Pro)/Cys-tRNA(Cys) deacylase
MDPRTSQPASTPADPVRPSSDTPRSDERTLGRLLESAGVAHELIAVGDYARTAEEAARNLNAPLSSIVKSLVCVTETGPVVALVPGDRVVSFGALDEVLGTKGARLAGRRLVERATGYVVGGVAPVGLPPGVRMVGDRSILDLRTVFCGAGSLHHMLRIRTEDLVKVVDAQWADICA